MAQQQQQQPYETASSASSSRNGSGFETRGGGLHQQRAASWTKRNSLLCTSAIVTKTSDLKMFDGICAGPTFVFEGEDLEVEFLEYQVRILKGNSCMIGLAPADKIQEYAGADVYQKLGWYLHQSDGSLWCQGRPGGGDAYTNCAIEENSIVGVRLYRDEKRVSFTVDGEDQGIAFSELWDGPFKLTVLLCRENNSVELL
ncbi:hypothetical protein BASA81_008847 [Batrachochytrium salamandrivorans]|nr:hypothetical protein BASA81_008847 [Batrachochytrium salamandrivorans]